MRKNLFFLFAVLLIGTGLAAGISNSSILLESGTIDAGKGISDELRESSGPMALQDVGRGNYILQFSGPVTERNKENLENEGVKFISYIPENAYIVSFRTTKTDSLIEKDYVKFITGFKPEYKISSGLQGEIGEFRGKVNVTAEFFPDVSDDEALEALKGYNAEKKGASHWRLDADRYDVEDLSRDSRIKRISISDASPSADNYWIRQKMNIEQLQHDPYNLNGSGLTAAQWDVGWADDHSDLNYTGKTVRGDAGCSESRCSVDDHATHVAGTMLGKGNVDSRHRGVAPDTDLVTYELPTSSQSELYSESDDAINTYNAILSQNSWSFKPSGCDTADSVYGNYPDWSKWYDAIISGDASSVNGRFSIVFSAGNEKEKCEPDFNTTTYPGTAKNVITVGALYRYKEAASFSSHGPTDDNRIKPDVSAIGVSVESTIPGNNYDYKSGTSMAAPAVSGVVTQVSQKYQREFGELPEPSTVKGILIQNAEDLNMTGPDFATGWGMVRGEESINYVDEAKAKDLIKTGDIYSLGYDSYSFEVDENSSVNITLVWTDHPGDTTAEKKLVNDLDLKVYNGAEKYYPWTIDWSSRKQGASRDQADHLNNVEQVFIPSASGTIDITVDSYNIPESPQNYSLIISQKKGEGLTPNLNVHSPLNQTYTSDPLFNMTSGEDLTNVTVELKNENHSLGNGGEREYYNSSIDLNSDRYTAIFYGKDIDGDWSKVEKQFTKDTEPPEILGKTVDDGDFVSAQKWLNVTLSDLSSISSRRFNISNGSEQKSGNLNYSLNTTTLEGGSYNLTYNVSDSLGYYRIRKVSFTVDNQDPQLNSRAPGRNISGSFSLNATWSDDSGVKNAIYQIKNSSGVVKQGDLNFTVDSTSLEDGKYDVVFQVEDLANHTVEDVYEIKVDNTAPDITISAPENGSYQSGDFSAEGFVNDAFSSIKSSNYTISNQTYSTTSSINKTVDSSGLKDGEYDIKFKASDNLDNYDSRTINITLDTTDPTISPGLKEGNYTGVVEIRSAWSDNLGVNKTTYTIENDSGIQREGELNDTMDSGTLGDGGYNLTYKVTDLADNTVEERFEIKIDNTPPEINVSSPGNGTFINQDLQLEAYWEENISAVREANYTLSNSTYSISGKLNDSIQVSKLDDGEYDIYFRAYDIANNSKTKRINITVDTTAPDASILNPSNQSFISGNFSSNASFSDDTSGVQGHSLYIKNSSGKQENLTVNSSLNSSKFEDGNYSLVINVSDRSSNFETEMFEIRIDNTYPKIEWLSPPPKNREEFSIRAVLNDNTVVNSSSYTVENSSGIQEQGAPNATIDSRTLEDGNYSLNISATDRSFNREVEDLEIKIDNTPPVISVKNPENHSFVNENFTVNASWMDETSGIEEANYRLYNSSSQSQGILNDTLTTSGLEEGKYNISYNVTDTFNNSISREVNISFDRTDPSIYLYMPSENSVIQDNFSVNASSSDAYSGLKGFNYFVLNSTGVQKLGNPNATVNSTKFEDGNYNVSVNATDKAGNLEVRTQDIRISNNAPTIRFSTIVNKDNISGSVDVNISVELGSLLNHSRFKWFNNSGNLTDWRELNYTEFDTSQFEEGEYTLNIWVNDTFGRYRSVNYTNITVDNSKPEISLQEKDSPEYGEWWKDNVTVEIVCSDDLTGIEQYSQGQEKLENGNVKLNSTGSKTYSFGCSDYAGNSNSTSKIYRIDGSRTSIKSLSPPTDEKTDRDFNLEIDFENETGESGVNVSATHVETSQGEVASMDIGNKSLTAEIQNLDYLEEYNVTGQIVDNVGHTFQVDLNYTVKSEPGQTSDDGSDEGTSDGGGAGGDSKSGISNEKDNQTSNSTNEKEEKECGPIHAVKSGGTRCRIYENVCVSPDGWKEVDSCEGWREDRATSIIRNLSSEDVDDQFYRRINTEYDEGNYSGVIRLAERLEEPSESEEGGLLDPMYIVALLFIGPVSYGVYRFYGYYRRRLLKNRMISKSNELAKSIKNGEAGEEFVKEFEQAYEEYEEGNYDRARSKLEKLN